MGDSIPDRDVEAPDLPLLLAISERLRELEEALDVLVPVTVLTVEGQKYVRVFVDVVKAIRLEIDLSWVAVDRGTRRAQRWADDGNEVMAARCMAEVRGIAHATGQFTLALAAALSLDEEPDEGALEFTREDARWLDLIERLGPGADGPEPPIDPTDGA